MTKRFPVVLFDSHCGICERSVAWLQRRDRGRVLRYVALDEPEGQEFLAAVGLPLEYRESMVFIEADGRFSNESTGILSALERLPGWRGTAQLLLKVPKGIRDPIYRFVARHRHRFGGPATACALPGHRH